MANKKNIVITAYGHEKTIDKISVSLFDKSDTSYSWNSESNARTYCDTINKMELKDNSWVVARIVKENTMFPLEIFPTSCLAVLLELDNLSIQRLLKELDFKEHSSLELTSQDIVKALKGERVAIQDRIFSNLPRKAAVMLKEDMEYMGPVQIEQVKEAQEKILNVIRHLEQSGEIVNGSIKTILSDETEE